MMMYNPGGHFTLTLQPFSPLTANQVFTFPDVGGTLLASPTPMTNGQLLIGSTGANPVPHTLSGGTSITITNGAGTINISQGNGFGTGGFTQSTPPSPNGGLGTPPTGNTVMQGLAGSIHINSTGRMMIIISGDIQNTNPNGGGIMQVYYGTGAAPAWNAAPPVGANVIGQPVTFQQSNPQDIFPFDLNGIPSGLAPGTYWLDIALQATGNAGSNTILNDISISAFEF